ncbi:hypothetical protein CBR_g10988 [Chara braunii]|uniref:Copper transport protein n=1 Tax=Chara braunii TaxID=69332 RepID=A0A388KPR8_CHABU|nr:hypothetical protein CBR_g10988 [Chara braunii]|eukprot:GBG72054.1 hypothetical protein CBR_g10988 [Chara braunii]
MNHSDMAGMDHSGMAGMDHSGMAGMDHSGMAGMDHSGMAGMDHSGMKSMNMMHMSFYFGQHVVILFDGWKTDKTWKYAVTLVGIFFWCILHEYLSTTRGKLEASIRSAEKGKGHPPCMYGLNANTIHFLAMTLYIVNVTSSYFLMLIVMTYNAGIFITLVSGLATGYLVFRRPGTRFYSSDVCCTV